MNLKKKLKSIDFEKYRILNEKLSTSCNNPCHQKSLFMRMQRKVTSIDVSNIINVCIQKSKDQT